MGRFIILSGPSCVGKGPLAGAIDRQLDGQHLRIAGGGFDERPYQDFDTSVRRHSPRTAKRQGMIGN
jgi:hypothetical protein